MLRGLYVTDLMYLQGKEHGSAAASDQDSPCPEEPSGAVDQAGAYNTGGLPRPGPKIPALGCSKCRHSSKGCKKCRSKRAEALKVRHQQALRCGMLRIVLLAKADALLTQASLRQC